MNVTPTYHPAAQSKDFPTPSRGVRPITNGPDKSIRCRNDGICDKATCVIWLTPWATTARSASRVHSVENSSSGRTGFASREEKWECLSIKKSICWRSNGMAASSQARVFRDLNTAGAYINSHPRHACMLSIQIAFHLLCPNPLHSSCLR